MGRQSSAIVAALGRSPYERPAPSDAKEFIAQQSARAQSVPGVYVQQYDERGRPQNAHAKAASKRLRKAQNDVLYGVGVVGKSEDWKVLKDVGEENGNGELVSGLDSLSTLVGGWWIHSLRARYQTFGIYSVLPLTQIIQTERSQLGFVEYYIPGFPLWIITSVLDVRNGHLLQTLLEVFGLLRQAPANTSSKEKKRRKRIEGLCRIGDHVLSVLSIPLQITSFLQMLHLLPTTFIPSAHAFLPFHPESLFGLPPPPQEITVPLITKFIGDLVLSPLVLLFIHEAAAHRLQWSLRRNLCKLVPIPDNPDHVSIRVASEGNLDERDIPGLGELSSGRASESNRTLMADVRRPESGIFAWVNYIRQRLESLMPVNDRATAARDNDADDSHRQLGSASVAQANQSQRHSDSQTERVQQLSGPSGQELIYESDLHSTQQDASMLSTTGVDAVEIVNNSNSTHPPALLDAVEGPNNESAPVPNTNFREDDPLDPHDSPAPQVEPRTTSSSAASTPPGSPTLRASFVHRDADSVTLQLEITPPGARSHDAPELEALQQRCVDAIGRMLWMRQAVLRDGAAITRNETINTHIDLMLMWTATPATRDLVANELRRQLERFNEIYERDRRIAFPNTEDSTMRALERNMPQMSWEEVRHLVNDARARYQEAIPTPPPVPPPHPLPPLPPTSEVLTLRYNTTSQPPNPHHRVTALSNHPAESFSSHAATLLTSLLLLPLESLFLRSLARQYLLRPTRGTVPFSPFTGHSPYDVRPLNSWFGVVSGRNLGIWSQVASYVPTMFLLLEIQELTYHVIWRVGTGWAVWMGREWHRWGEL